MKKLICIALVFIMVISASACARKEKKRYQAEFLELFDTETKIVSYLESKKEFNRQVEFIYNTLEEYNNLYDIYNNYEGLNNIKTINDNAGIMPVKADKRIIDLLLFSKKAYEITGGRTNIAFGSVLKIWHKYRTEGIDDPENAKLPPMDLLAEAAKHMDINKIIIDEAGSTVYLSDPDMSLDVGAVAKGYAVEQVCGLAVENGFASGLVSVGGNIKAIGMKNENGQLWNVGIKNPNKESDQSMLHISYIKDASLVTSGSYERHYTVNGKEYNHIIDPVTLMPAGYFSSCTILAKDSGIADALSTAVFIMPFDEGKQLVASLPDADALWVFPDGTIKYSSNFK